MSANVKPESKIWEMKMTDLFKGEICLKYEQQIYHQNVKVKTHAAILKNFCYYNLIRNTRYTAEPVSKLSEGVHDCCLT